MTYEKAYRANLLKNIKKLGQKRVHRNNAGMNLAFSTNRYLFSKKYVAKIAAILSLFFYAAPLFATPQKKVTSKKGSSVHSEKAAITKVRLTSPLRNEMLSHSAKEKPVNLAEENKPSESIGSPTTGKLKNGVKFQDSSVAKLSNAYGNTNVRYGTSELVALIHYASKRVAKDYPKSVLNVGQLSAPDGGDVDRHVSHESGRDVDLGFYIKNAKGEPIFPSSFERFDEQGKAPEHSGHLFDDARNWKLVESLLQNPNAHVSHVFISPKLRSRLLAYAKSHATEGLRNQASFLLSAPPKNAQPHDDHFHVRISCPKGDQSCVENPVVVHVKKTSKHVATKKKTKSSLKTIAHKTPITRKYSVKTTKTEVEYTSSHANDDEEDPLDKFLTPQVEGLGSIHADKKR